MELQLGLKITKTRDDIGSISEYKLAKETKGPIFQSRETNTMFILTAHLKGYKRNNIDIKISEDGRKISISGEKPIQEMLMMGWVMQRKEVGFTGFNKVFKIPDGVILDRIKAKYDEEEWMLNIVMPKLVKGICGARVEEIKETESSSRGRSELEKSEAETSQKGSKESEIQALEESEGFMEKKESEHKMHDDANMEITKERMQKEVEEFKFGTEDGNGESVRENIGFGKEGYEAMKKSDLEQNVGGLVSQKTGDTNQDEESEIRKTKESENAEKNGGVFDKVLDGTKGNLNGEMIQKEEEESKLGTEDGDGEKESVIHQLEETKNSVEKMEREESGKMIGKAKGDSTKRDTCEESEQKESGESVKESGMEELEAMKTAELDQNVADHIPSNMDDNTSQEELKKYRIQEVKKTERTEEKMDGGESERVPAKDKEDIQKRIFGDDMQMEIKKPEVETKDGDQECVREKAGNEEFDAVKTTREEVPKEIPKATLEESEGLNVSNMHETRDDKEERVEKRGKEIEYFEEKGEGEEPKRMHVEEKKDKRKETMQEENEKVKNGIGDQKNVQKSTVRGIFEVPNKRKLSKQVGEVDGSKRFKDEKMEEQKDVIKEAMAVTESLMEKVKEEQYKKRTEEDEKDKIDYDIVKFKGEGPKKIDVEPNEMLEEDTIDREITKPKLKSSYHQSGKEKVDHGGSDKSKRGKFPGMGKTDDVKKVKAKIEQPAKKVDGDKYKLQVEASGDFMKDTTRETTWREKDKHHLQEGMSKGRIEARKDSKEEFPMKMTDSLTNNREEPKGRKIEEKGDKEELIKQKSKERKKKTEVEEKGAGIEHLAKKVTEDEANGGLRENSEEPKIQSKEKKEQNFVEGVSKRRYESSKTAREFPQKIADSFAKTKEGPKDKEREDKVAKGNSEETKVVESTRKGKIQEPESEKAYQTFQEVPEEKYLARELQPTEVPTTSEEVSMGFKEVEQRSEKDKKQKTELPSPKIQSKETRESKNESMNKDILKPKKAKVEEEQYTQNTVSTKEAATIEDQVPKPLSAPRFPSTQQSKVEEKDKRRKAKHESQKQDPAKDMKNFTEMKNQESKQMESLKPEISRETQLKKEEQVRKDEFHKGERVEEKFQEETEGTKDKIDDREQQYEQRDVDKGVGKVGAIGKEMPKKGYVAEREETKGDLKAAHVREKYKTPQNVNDEKPKKQEEIIKADIAKVDKAKGIGESSKLQSPTVTQQSKDEERRKPDNIAEEQEASRKSSKKNVAEYNKMDRVQQKHVQEKNDKKGYQATRAVEEDFLKREGPKFAKSEEANKVSRQLFKREREETTQTAEDKKSKMMKTIPEFEKANGFKQVAKEMGETQERKYKTEPEEVTSNLGKEPPSTVEITPKKENEKSQTDEKPPVPTGIQRKEPDELPWPSKDYEIPNIEEVQQEKKGRRRSNEQDTITSTREGLPQATANHSKAKSNVEPKGETDKPEANQMQSPSVEMSSEEPRELDEFSIKENDSTAESSVQVKKEKESIHCIEDTKALEAEAEKFAEPSKFSSSSSAQQFEVEGMDKTDARHEVGKQESQEAEEIEALQEQIESLASPQCMNKDQEESHGIHEIEKEKSYYKQGDEVGEKDSQVLEKQKESKEETSERKKEDKKRPRKLFVPLVMAGSALLVSLIVIFVRHRRSRKRCTK